MLLKDIAKNLKENKILYNPNDGIPKECHATCTLADNTYQLCYTKTVLSAGYRSIILTIEPQPHEDDEELIKKAFFNDDETCLRTVIAKKGKTTFLGVKKEVEVIGPKAPKGFAQVISSCITCNNNVNATLKQLKEWHVEHLNERKSEHPKFEVSLQFAIEEIGRFASYYGEEFYALDICNSLIPMAIKENTF